MRSKKWKINTEKTEQENKGSEFNVGRYRKGNRVREIKIVTESGEERKGKLRKKTGNYLLGFQQMFTYGTLQYPQII